jgi:hypothetical protein
LLRILIDWSVQPCLIDRAPEMTFRLGQVDQPLGRSMFELRSISAGPILTISLLVAPTCGFRAALAVGTVAASLPPVVDAFAEADRLDQAPVTLTR